MEDDQRDRKNVYHTAADDNLRFRRRVRGSFDACLRPSVENPGDPVRLGQDGTVAEAQGETQAHP